MANNQSPMQRLASQPRECWERFLHSLSPQEKSALTYKWRGWKARPNQLAPDSDWHVLLVMAGRGFGKTRMGAEWVREQVERGAAKRVALVAETEADGRDVMVEGESGILAISPPGFQPLYEPSKRRLTWPNGAIATLYSGDEPDQLRGPQHDAAWCDEPAKWQYGVETWNNLEFGLRLGPKPRIVATTTPRPVKLLQKLVKDPKVIVVRGSTFDNAKNLPESYLVRVREQHEGTRVGRQELFGELLEDVFGALWNRQQLEDCRIAPRLMPQMKRIVVAIDPAVTARHESDETGIIVAGKGVDDKGYVLADLTCKMSPEGWARRAVNAYRSWGADRIIAESNNGGDLVGATLRTVDPGVSFREVRASRGKIVRAEPVAALYEQHKIFHVGRFDELEEQLASFTPENVADKSPDRADALVWALTELFITDQEPGIIGYYRILNELAAKEKAEAQKKPAAPPWVAPKHYST